MHRHHERIRQSWNKPGNVSHIVVRILDAQPRYNRLRVSKPTSKRYSQWLTSCPPAGIEVALSSFLLEKIPSTVTAQPLRVLCTEETDPYVKAGQTYIHLLVNCRLLRSWGTRGIHKLLPTVDHFRISVETLLYTHLAPRAWGLY
jgi:hypothetical protein